MKKILIVAALVIASCIVSVTLAESNSATDRLKAIRAALAHPNRPAADRERDADRKPDEVLDLVGVEPGMHIADLMAGSGWYTEILARVTGTDGRVYALNNHTSVKPYGKAFTQRIQESKLQNVIALVRELEDPGLPVGQLDVVFMVQFYHDTYWMKVDREAMNIKIFESLKPGGIFCVIDHRAEAGSGQRDVRRLHRIDPELVKQELLMAGFELETSSDLFQNKADQLILNVFDSGIRGHTDRFLFKFRKPN